MAGELQECIGKVAIEHVLATADFFVSLSQNAFEVFWRDKDGQGRDCTRLDPTLHKGGDRSVDLIFAQFDC